MWETVSLHNGMEKRQWLTHVEDQVQCSCNHAGTQRVFMPEFASELPPKEKEAFDLTTDKGKNWANKKAMMQFALSWTKVAQLNKLNCATRANKDWPSRKAHEVMMQLVKEYKPDDTMVKIDMKKALSKLSLSKKKNLNDINNGLSAIECRYTIDITK
jgi:hypothetical protein